MIILDFNTSENKNIKKNRYQRYSIEKLKSFFPHLNKNDIELLPSLRVYGKLDDASMWLVLQDPLAKSKYKRYISLLLYGVVYIITSQTRNIRFVSNFFIDNLHFYRGFKAYNLQPYYSNLAAFPLSRHFVFPNDFGLLPTKLYHGTRSKKRLNRIKYRDSIYYNEWVGFQKLRITSFYQFSTFKKPYLRRVRKHWETTIPNFNPLTYIPTTLHDALCYFFIYGPPLKNCKDKKKIRLFFTVLLSGLYYDRKSPASICNMFFERRLLLSQFQEEEIASTSDKINELRFVFPNDSTLKLKTRVWFRKTHNFIYDIFQSVRKVVSHNANKIGSWLYLFYGYWSRHIKTQLGYIIDVSTLLWREITPFFVPNPLSFVWGLIPYNVEYWLAKAYVFSAEIFYEGRQFFYYDEEESHSVSSGLYTEMAEYYFITQWTDMWYDYIMYYSYRIFNPIRELLIELPFWTIMNYAMAVWAHGGTLLNNLWYGILTFRNTQNKIKGRWYKIPLILVRWLFHWVLFFIFIFIFIFYIDYKDVGYYLGYLIPFSPYLHSVHTTYILAIILTAFRFLGPYSLQELMRVDMAWDGWLNVLYVNLAFMLDLAPYAMPNTAYSSENYTWGLNRDQLIVFSHDKPIPVTTGFPLQYLGTTTGITAPEYVVQTFRYDTDGALYGEDSKAVEMIKSRRL